MRPVSKIEGTMVPLDRADVDTDQIMPKQHLKRIERTGFAKLVFSSWREAGGFVLDEPARQGAKVLVTGPNFGSGSSREHAPWGLQQWGFEAVVAPSFADIFRNNCAKIGLLTVTLGAATCHRLLEVAADPRATCRIDVAALRLAAGDVDVEFDLDRHTQRRLLEGLDDIGMTLQQVDAIDAFESQRPGWLPVTSA